MADFRCRWKRSTRPFAYAVAPNWLDELPWVLLGISTAPKEDLQCSSAELVYGTPLMVPGDFMATPQGQQLSSHTSASWSASLYLLPPPDMEVPRFLFHILYRAANMFSSAATLISLLCSIPMKAHSTSWKGVLKIDIGGNADSVSIDHLKPAHLDPDLPVQVALPPRQGRPPAKKEINGSGGGSCGRQHADRT